MYEHLRQLVSSLALDDHVLFAGHLDGELKWASFAAAELFLLPSRQENFAIAVAEAMQMGVPVVITDKVNTWPYVEEAGAGLVLADRDINALLPQAIETLLTDDATRSRMAVQGRRYARDRLTWHASAQKLLACYDQVLSGANSAGRSRWKLGGSRIWRVLAAPRVGARPGARNCGGCSRRSLCCLRRSTCSPGGGWR